MANPQYGGAYHELKNFTPSMILAPMEGGTALANTVYFSPQIRDMKIASGGVLTETMGVDGSIGHIEVHGEFVMITLTVLPFGDTDAKAKLGINLIRVGTPWKVTAAGPSVVMMGHTNNGFLGGGSIFALNNIIHMESHDLDFSVEAKTGGTMTFKLRPGLIAAGTPIYTT
jgi:hypothetical protein